jgi:hypothetical protein
LRVVVAGFAPAEFPDHAAEQFKRFYEVGSDRQAPLSMESFGPAAIHSA